MSEKGVQGMRDVRVQNDCDMDLDERLCLETKIFRNRYGIQQSIQRKEE